MVPTIGHAQGAQATGPSVASLSLSAQAAIPASVQLSIGASVVTFQLESDADAEAGQSVACLVGEARDLEIALDPSGVARVAPGGTRFRDDEWPSVVLTGGPPLEGFPPPQDAGSIVCYATFLVAPFATTADWSLTVERFDTADSQSIEWLYLGGGCRGADPPGLVRIRNGDAFTFASSMDDVRCDEARVVLAVKIQESTATETTSTLRYTLASAAGDLSFD